jgi:predicted dehydrogenase
MENHYINWGIIGCGDVAEIKSGPAFQKTKQSKLISVMRRNADKVKDFAKRHNVPFWTTNALDILNDRNINAIYIATPPSSHLEYALQAINLGKHVYLEKPMVLNTDEAKILVEAVGNKGSKLTVAHYRRYLPVFVKVKELIESNVIGKVTHAKIKIAQTKSASLIAKSDENWRTNPEVSGGGYFHDIAPHQIDLMYYYFGEINSVKGINTKKNMQTNDLVEGSLQFKNGVYFEGSWNFNAKDDNDSCIIHGEKGTISFSFYKEFIHLSISGKEENFQFEAPKHVQQPMIQETVNYFLGKNSNPCSVEEGLIITEIMDTFCGN